MPLDRRGARVASQQSSILHNGAYSLTMTCISGKNRGSVLAFKQPLDYPLNDFILFVSYSIDRAGYVIDYLRFTIDYCFFFVAGKNPCKSC